MKTERQKLAVRILLEIGGKCRTDTLRELAKEAETLGYTDMVKMAVDTADLIDSDDEVNREKEKGRLKLLNSINRETEDE